MQSMQGIIADIAREIAKLNTVASSASAALNTFGKTMSSIPAPTFARSTPTAATGRTVWWWATMKVLYEKVPTCLGRDLRNVRMDRTEEDWNDRTRTIPGEPDFEKGLRRLYRTSVNRTDMIEALCGCQFKRERYGVHSAWVFAIEGMVDRWDEDAHQELVRHVAASDPSVVDEARKREEAEKARMMLELAEAARRKDELAQRVRAEEQRRVEEEELAEVVLFMERMHATPHAGGW